MKTAIEVIASPVEINKQYNFKAGYETSLKLAETHGDYTLIRYYSNKLIMLQEGK